jgi:hypothetical protein
LVDLGGLSDHDRRSGFASRIFGELDGGTFAVVGDHDVTKDGKDPVWRWHLHDEVGVVWYGHELDQHRLTKDGVVGGAKVCDLKC